MHPKKKSLSVVRETVRQLSEPALSDVRGGIIVPTSGCVPATYRHSCFDSCFKSDCCLMVP